MRRAGTVADRINEKLRAASVSTSPTLPQHRPQLSIDGKTLPPPPSFISSGGDSPTKEDAFIPPTEPNGKPSMSSAIPPVPQKDTPKSPAREMRSSSILLSGLSLPLHGLHDLINRFDAYLLTNPAPYSDASLNSSAHRSNAALATRHRSSILGSYEKTFSGEELTDWLRENVEGFGGDWNRCVEAAGELHKMGYLSRLGVGRGFDSSFDTFFVLKQASSRTTYSFPSPVSPSTSANLQSMIKSYLPGPLATTDEPSHLRLRKDATKADEAYKEGVMNAEERRLDMEERIERGLRLWERWERERLSVVQAGTPFTS